MQAAPQAVIRSVITSGHGDKLRIGFTHFDGVKGDAFPNTTSKKNHVFASVEQTIFHLEEIIGSTFSRSIMKNLHERCFYFSKIHEVLPEGAKFTKGEFERLVTSVVKAIEPLEMKNVQLTYDLSQLEACVQKATEDYFQSWQVKLGTIRSSQKYPEHWTGIKALNRRITLLDSDEYDTLRPVADLRKELCDRIFTFINQPQQKPTESEDDEDFVHTVEEIMKLISAALSKVTHDRIISSPFARWQRSFDYSGTGSAKKRSTTIQSILQEGTLIESQPSLLEKDLLQAVAEIVEEAIVKMDGRLVV